MRYEIAPLPALLLSVLVAQAALARPAIGQRWTVPTPASSVIDYRVGSPRIDAPPPSPFEFDDHRPRGPAGRPPPRPNDRNVVLGLGLPWTDGRPPLDCAQTPVDAKCH